MSPEYFDNFLPKYGYYPEYAESGFYISPRSAYTKELASAEGGIMPVVLKALEMKEGEYSEVECDFGVCFIYKAVKKEYAYLDSELEVFFSDFYLKAAESMLSESVATLAAEVQVKEGFYSLNLADMPHNTLLMIEY